jgi:zinc protease
LWQASRGRLSLSEAYFLNQQALIDETITRFPGAEKVNFNSDDIQEGMKKDRNFIMGLNQLHAQGMKVEKDVLGLIHDRDVIAFWGDPLWEARFDAKRKPHALQSSWKEKDGKWVLTLTANEDYSGNYPLWLPKRLNAPKLSKAEGAELDVFVADDFLMIRKVTMKKGTTIDLEITGA